MDIASCVRSRRSIRRFTDEKVDRAALERVIALAGCSPSWKNTQTARYIAVEDRAIMLRLANECVMGHEGNRRIIEGAPAIVVLTYISGRAGYERDGSYSTSKGAHFESFDAGIAAQTFCLAACNEGLGTVIMGIFDETKVMELIGTPEGQKIAALIAIGHPAEAPDMPKRKPVEELLSFR